MDLPSCLMIAGQMPQTCRRDEGEFSPGFSSFPPGVKVRSVLRQAASVSRRNSGTLAPRDTHRSGVTPCTVRWTACHLSAPRWPFCQIFPFRGCCVRGECCGRLTDWLPLVIEIETGLPEQRIGLAPQRADQRCRSSTAHTVDQGGRPVGHAGLRMRHGGAAGDDRAAGASLGGWGQTRRNVTCRLFHSASGQSSWE